MGDENPSQYSTEGLSKPSHEGYRKTIELLVGNNVVPLRFDTIWLVQFHGLRSKDPNQHLKDFIKLMDSLDLDGDNRERTRLTVKLRNDILMFQQTSWESFSESMTRFKDLLQKVSHHGIDLWLQVQICYDHDNPVTRRTIDQSAGVQRLMEAHLALKQPTQLNKITTSCEICSGPHDTQYCMKDPKKSFVEYASSRTNKARGKCSINTITIHPKQQSDSRDDKTEENGEEKRNRPENHSDCSTPPDPLIAFITKKVLKFNSLFESLGLVPPSPNAELVCTKEEDGDVMFIEIIPRDDNSHKEEPEPRVQEVEYFDIFPTRSELAYHKYLMCGPIPSIFLRNPIIIEGSSLNLKIPCNIGHVHVEKAYIDLNSPLIS
ncbi:hypothetical protein Tco_1078584 [Tanacetum coccineum]|uniref:MAK10-like protein n=1 Tax=Tanacetum coccineum TaxID=301880 RepID=A0ABQ5HPJ0_9ASTR